MRTTRDGVPVLHHDPTLRRRWGAPDAVADLPLARLRALAPGVPTLSEALDVVRGTGVPLVLDLGEAAVARAAVRVVDAAGGAWDADPARAAVWFCGAPGALAALAADEVPAPRLLSWDRPAPVPDDLVDAVRPAFVNLRHRLLTARSVRRWHERGLLVSAWTVDSGRRRRRLLAWGVDAVVSNDVRGLVADVSAS